MQAKTTGGRLSGNATNVPSDTLQKRKRSDTLDIPAKKPRTTGKPLKAAPVTMTTPTAASTTPIAATPVDATPVDATPMTITPISMDTLALPQGMEVDRTVSATAPAAKRQRTTGRVRRSSYKAIVSMLNDVSKDRNNVDKTPAEGRTGTKNANPAPCPQQQPSPPSGVPAGAAVTANPPEGTVAAEKKDPREALLEKYARSKLTLGDWTGPNLLDESWSLPKRSLWHALALDVVLQATLAAEDTGSEIGEHTRVGVLTNRQQPASPPLGKKKAPKPVSRRKPRKQPTARNLRA
jgi:hypothetical protein